MVIALHLVLNSDKNKNQINMPVSLEINSQEEYVSLLNERIEEYNYEPVDSIELKKALDDLKIIYNI